MEMSEVMRRRRAELDMSQVELAAASGVDKRQIRRYESGAQQPTLPVASALARALKISVGELAGEDTRRVDLTGTWWSSWQTFLDGSEVITAQEVRFQHRGEQIAVEAISRGNVTIDEGGYLWRGELRLWDNEILMGWYAADDGAVRSKGTMYFVLHPHGVHLLGRWVGLSYDGKIVSGWGAMARNEEDAKALVETLKDGTALSR